jgi:prepilin-type N-terminal cleavage/methylation domain-containing protein
MSRSIIRSTRGYSLMELVVVLAILAVAAALIGPAVGRAADAARARAEAGAVAAFLRAAREHAVTGRQPLEVALDRERHALLLQRPTREGEPTSPTLSPPGREPSLTLSPPGREPSFTLSPQGRGQGEGTVLARRAFAARVAMDAGTISDSRPTAGAGVVTFLPHGMSSGGRLTVETAGPRTYIITVDALTGRVATRQVTQ